MDQWKVESRKMQQLVLMALFFFAGITASIRIEDLQVPPQVRNGETVKLKCGLNFEGDSVYTLTWWKNEHQFYKYIVQSKSKSPKTVFPVDGIRVDLGRSDLEQVVLRDVSLSTSGQFRCEVVAESPTFERDARMKNMTVVDFPDRAPVLEVGDTFYSPRETLVANCTSPRVHPAPHFHWYINNGKVDPYFSRIISLGRSINSPLLSPTSQLTISLQEFHFNDGKINLSCNSRIPDIYEQKTDAVLYRAGYKSMAPSQKLYGNSGESFLKVVE